MFAIHPLLLLAGIALYAVLASVRDHFRYKNSIKEASAHDKPYTLEVRKGSQAVQQSGKAA